MASPPLTAPAFAGGARKGDRQGVGVVVLTGDDARIAALTPRAGRSAHAAGAVLGRFDGVPKLAQWPD
ncbi:hypothetical protein GCM10009859_20790 [Kocuria salsicia]